MRRERFGTLLVDFDGVIRLWPGTDRAVEERFGLPVGSLRAEAFSPMRLGDAIRGRVSDDAWRRGVAEALHARHPEADAFAAVEAWSASPGRIDRDTLSLLRRHEPSGGIVLFTNATSRLDDDLAALGVRSAFRAVINSSEVGAAKPELGMFEAAIRTCGGDPERIAYVDDTLENVELGRSLGITGHRHRPDRSLTGFLADCFPPESKR